MDWEQAQNRIRAHVKVGTDLNTSVSTFRFVKSIEAPINSARYGYDDEKGFVVPIGQSTKIKIPWSMLEECFRQLDSLQGYDSEFFRERFPLQHEDHPCHVHVVGRIFVVAGIAQLEGNKYRAAAV